MLYNNSISQSLIEDGVLYLFFNDSGIQKGGGIIKEPFRVIENKTLVNKINTLIGKKVTIEHNDFIEIGSVIDAGFHQDVITPSGKRINADGSFFAKILLNSNIPLDVVLDKFDGVSSEISGDFQSITLNKYNGIDERVLDKKIIQDVAPFRKILDFKEYVGITLTNEPRSSETRIENSVNDNLIMNEETKKELASIIASTIKNSMSESAKQIMNMYETQEDKEKKIANMAEEVKAISNKIKNMEEKEDKIENMQKIINTLEEKVNNMCEKMKNSTEEVKEEVKEDVKEDVENEVDKEDEKSIDNKINNSLNKQEVNWTLNF